MAGPAPAGLFLYAADVAGVAAFYEGLLGMARQHARADLVVLSGSGVQLLVHALSDDAPAEAAGGGRAPPRLKFFFTVPDLEAARGRAVALGGQVLAPDYAGPGFRACNALDPEGNVFHLRAPAG